MLLGQPCVLAEQAMPALHDYEYELPLGTTLAAMIQEDVSTETAILGQPISAVVAQDVYIGNKKVLSRSDRILGRITRIDPPVTGRNAILKVEFDTLALAEGIHLPFVAWVNTEQKDHYWGGEATEGTKAEVIPYKVYRIGTYGRVEYHGPRKMGEHVKLLPGERMVVVLSAPVKIYAF
jgi:hypothetical protein